MRVIFPQAVPQNCQCEELAGPFGTLAQAEQYVDAPPEGLGDPGTVTIDHDARGDWYVYSVEQRHAA